MSENVSNRNTKGEPVAQGMIARVTQALRYVVTGASPDAWFGPLQPLPPVAQDKAVGRQLDYDMGFNLRQTPKQTEGTDFASLRALADGYDLLRLVIETRKDQIAGLIWDIKPKDESKDGKGDARIEEVRQFFAYPDKEHTWSVWLRAVIEDLLVIDAPTLYPHLTNGGQLYALELMDGASVKRIIDDTGRTPVPPNPAYQQVLKGLPAVDYTRDTLIYAPRNIRTNRIYGFSPVEQVMMTVNIAIRRQLSQLQFYTDGSTPDLVFGVPDTWQPDQIRQFQEWWDSTLQGNTAARRGARFISGGMTPYNTKDQLLKDQYDEWLARIICYAFSVSPQALMAMMNRATAQTAAASSHQEGLRPLMQWIKSLIDLVLAKYFGYADLEFHWNDDQSVDPLTQSQIDVAYVTAKIKDPNEVRAELGMAALTPEQEEKLNPPPPEPLMGGGPMDGKPEPPIQNDKKQSAEGLYLGKALPLTFAKASTVPAIKRERRAVKQAQDAIEQHIKKWLAESKADLTKQALEYLDSHRTAKISKGNMSSGIDAIRNLLDVTAGLVTLYGEMQDSLAQLTEDGAIEALIQVGMNDAPEVILNLANKNALAWSQDHAAEMVGKKLVAGELMDNPDAQWVITERQRTETAKLIDEAMQEGWSNDALSSKLSDAAGFSDSRALMIARTETAMADVQGNMIGYRVSGLVTGKEWILGEEACDDCVLNSEAGTIGFDALFPSGDDAPPAHPNCFSGDAVVSAASVSLHYKRWFDGEVVVLGIAGTDELTVTPNHPILTDRGWIAASALQIGDSVFKGFDPGAIVAALDPDNHHIETRIEDIASALKMAGGVASAGVPSAAKAFHGDGVANGKIDVVRAASLLQNDRQTKQGLENLSLGIGQWASRLLDGNTAPAKLIEADLSSTNSSVSGGDVRSAHVGSGFGHSHGHGIASTSDGQSHSDENVAQCGAVAAETLCQINAGFSSHVGGVKAGHVSITEAARKLFRSLETSSGQAQCGKETQDNFRSDTDGRGDGLHRLAPLVSKVKVTDITFRHFEGHVFNLETANGWYFANGIISHNCRCDILPIVIDESSHDNPED